MGLKLFIYYANSCVFKFHLFLLGCFGLMLDLDVDELHSIVLFFTTICASAVICILLLLFLSPVGGLVSSGQSSHRRLLPEQLLATALYEVLYLPSPFPWIIINLCNLAVFIIDPRY